MEAARAGEAGAGFAVVADEVRNLAIRAADAAKNTSDLIAGTVEKVGEGTALVADTNAAFQKAADSSVKVAALVAEIAAASNEQAQGIGQINTAVTEMDSVVQQNAASAEESASTSEEMSAQAEEMKGFVRRLVVMIEGRKRHPSMESAGPGRALAGPKTVPSVQRQVNAKTEAGPEGDPDGIMQLKNEDFRDL